ncbi:MAG TPA: wax ester/triacylglycerol synthase family O-acyltransferase [Acidimicrobiales bacterium]|nr:wax ester/triacylglycerol synthase family O-acyltransferase [Acidimicrobiales bacterium]
MERLGGVDGAFLSLESPTTHLHIIGALVFDPSGVDGGVDFWRVRDMVGRRLPLVPPFRKRLVEVPFGLQHPAMIDDPDFDLDYHVRRVALPGPGGPAELAELVADLASRPLDRQRPLWEFHVVEGLAHGQLALVPKVHHSILDGVSGAEVLAAFFDLSPEPVPRPLFGSGARSGRVAQPGTVGGSKVRDSAPEGAGGGPGWAPDPLPGEVVRWRDVVGSLPAHADALLRTVTRTVRSARGLTGRNREMESAPPPSPFEAPATSINRAISSHRRVAFAELSMSDVRRVREILGGTTNDVVLTVAGGAMRRFFTARGEDLGESLVALVPVSVRQESERDALGNRISAMLVSLSTSVEDDAARLQQIRQDVHAAKEQSRIVGSDLLAGWAQAAVPVVATRLSRLATNFRLFDHVPPIFNLIVSNVPGPDFPLYMAGARLVSMYPVGPIIEGAGINITVFSYLDTLYVGVQGCWDLVPDIALIAKGVNESLGALVCATNRLVRPVPWWHAEIPA